MLTMIRTVIAVIIVSVLVLSEEHNEGDEGTCTSSNSTEDKCSGKTVTQLQNHCLHNVYIIDPFLLKLSFNVQNQRLKRGRRRRTTRS